MRFISLFLVVTLLCIIGGARGHDTLFGTAGSYASNRAALPEPLPTVTVQVHGVRSAEGRLYVALHGERGYPFERDQALAQVQLPAAMGDMHVHLPIPGSGRFGVIVLHDEDSSGDLTRSWLGLPTEGYVGGNNEQALNRPTFEKDSLELSADTVVDLTLWYP